MRTLLVMAPHPDLAEAQTAASRVVKDVARASEIIGRVRSLFKKDSLQREEVEINELIQEMIALLRGEAPRHSISVHSDLSRELPPIMADRVQLQQVLMNLMLNGIEAMKDTSTPRILTVATQQDKSGHILASVTDTGVGLQPEQTEQVFKAFFTTKSQGTGMGLTISRSIIESHGGRLCAIPNDGPGATFSSPCPSRSRPRDKRIVLVGAPARCCRTRHGAVVRTPPWKRSHWPGADPWHVGGGA